MIKTYTYDSLTPGKKLLILGAIHGNEPCGTIAIQKIMNNLDEGHILLKQGSVVFIPICNPLAYQKNVRFVEENLARIFDSYIKPDTYEKKLATTIAEHIKRCDYILDIHSGNAENAKFIFQDYEESKYQELTESLGFEMVIHGWSHIYANNIGQDVTGYAHTLDKTSVVIECGQHTDPEAPDIAYNAIRTCMATYGLIDSEVHKIKQKHITMQKLYYMEKQGKFIHDWKHGDTVSLGENIAIYEDGEYVKSEYNGYIILPKTFAQKGDEWFYVGTENIHS